MHRTTFLPRSLTWSLSIGFFLGALSQSASAQGPDRQQLPGFGQQFKEFGDPKDVKGGVKEVLEPGILVLPKDSTRQIEMSTKELISEFRTENPKVVKVQALLDNPRAVLVSGVSSGNTRIYLTDVKKNTESLDVRVPLDEEAEAEAKRVKLTEQIRRAVPTASVEVQAWKNVFVGSTVVQTASSTTTYAPKQWTVSLNGHVRNAESVHVILALTSGVFENPNIVNNMRIGGVQQVLLEVTIARVNRSRARNVGFTFLQTGQQHFLASSIGGGSLTATSTLPSILAPAASLTSAPNAVFGIFNDKEGFFGYLNALTTEGLAKLIAEPKIMTQSGRPGWFVSGGETPILTSSGNSGPTVTYKTFGTIVSFLPVVLEDGKIHLEVRPEISSRNDANGISVASAVGPTNVPGFDLRSVQVAVEMEDGQTLAVGGLIQNNVDAQNSKVPILGDLPLIGFAFSNKTYKELEEELVILVTPHLVDPMACCQLPKYLPGRETRTADDFELFLEGILEAPRGQRNLTHPYTAAYMNGPSSALYPCGDSSGCGGRCAPQGSANAGPCGTFSTVNGCSAPSAAPQKADVRLVGNTVAETPHPVAFPAAVREPAPLTQPTATVPSTLPTLPPVTNPGTMNETRLPAAVFGPAVLTDR